MVINRLYVVHSLFTSKFSSVFVIC